MDVSEEFHHFMFQLFFCGLTEIHGNPACLMVENLDAKRRQRDKEGGQTGQISQKGRADIPKRKGRQGRHPKKEANPRQTSQKGREPRADSVNPPRINRIRYIGNSLCSHDHEHHP